MTLTGIGGAKGDGVGGAGPGGGDAAALGGHGALGVGQAGGRHGELDLGGAGGGDVRMPRTDSVTSTMPREPQPCEALLAEPLSSQASGVKVPPSASQPAQP